MADKFRIYWFYISLPEHFEKESRVLDTGNPFTDSFSDIFHKTKCYNILRRFFISFKFCPFWMNFNNICKLQ